MAHFIDFLATLYCEFVLDRLVHALRSRRMQMDTTGGGEVQPCFSSIILLIPKQHFTTGGAGSGSGGLVSRRFTRFREISGSGKTSPLLFSTYNLPCSLI